jgi:hypothetical protein
MKHLLSYNESFDSQDKLQSLLQKFGKSDTKELFKLLTPYKDKLRKVAAKYTVNGVIDAGLIEKDIKRFNLSTNEGLNENVIIRLFVRIINLPINLVRIVIHFFKNIWDELDWMKGFQVFMVALVVFVLSFAIYQIGEHAINGISVGIVNTEIKFVPEHYETHYHTYTDSNGHSHTYTTEEFIPDTWSMDVRASNGRIETWETIDHNTGVNTHKEDVARKTDKWEWIETKEYGEETGGSFSGGGTGASY